MNLLLRSGRRDSAKTNRPSCHLGNLQHSFKYLLLCTFLIIAACAKAPVKPVEFAENDTCFHCKSPIAAKDVRFAGEFITSNGFVRKFDDIGCLAANAKKVGKNNIVAFYASDIVSGKLLPAEQLQFVRCDKVATPKKSGIVAFQDPAKADEYIARLKGYNPEKIKPDDLLR
jgi:copper chaperone NosL